MKYTGYILLIVVLLTQKVNGQDLVLTLTNQANNNRQKSIKIKSHSNYWVEYQTSVDTVNRSRTIVRVNGDITGISKDSIVLKTVGQNVSVYVNDTLRDPHYCINISKGDIHSIDINKASGNPFATIVFLGLVNSVIISPLVSIDFNSGTVNSERFTRLAGISSLVTVASLALLPTRYKTYWIIHDKKKKKRLWKIE